jgi:predicted SnoaL-like aldol condensation-catalyzing enzyme
MEAYLSEKIPSIQQDSLTSIKHKFYSAIFSKHKTDSSDFYTTLYYLQIHPNELDSILINIDKRLLKINPKDTTKIVQKLTKPVLNVIEKDRLFNEQVKENFLKRKKYNNNTQNTE